MKRSQSRPLEGKIPPGGALWILEKVLPADVSQMVLDDLTEIFQARVTTGARMNSLWFWGQTALFCMSFSWERLGGETLRRPRRARGGEGGPTPGGGDRRVRGWSLRGRQTVRRLRRDWRYSVGIVLILGLGIGPASTMLSVVNKVLLKPLGYSEPDRLGLVRIDIGELHDHPGLARSEIVDLQGLEELFKTVAGLDRGQEVTLGEGEEMVPVFLKLATPGLFEMLGVPPRAGRTFTVSDLETPVVLISHRLWQNHFGADPDMVGRTILMNGRGMEVVGIMPADFALRLRRGSAIHRPVDIWFPFDLGEHRAFWGFPTLVRLEDGVSFEQANSALITFAQGLKEAYPGAYADAPLAFVVHPLLPDLVQETRPAVNAAMAGVLLLLLTAVVNATALMVMGLKGREQELAVRSAIGAGRRALVAEMVMESVVLSGVAAAVGGGLALLGITALRNIIPRSVPRWETIALGWEPLVISGVLGFLALLIAGVIPAWKVARGTPWEGMSASSGRGRTRTMGGQTVLVGVQVAMAVVLLFGALQLGRSARELATTDLRFDPSNVLAFKAPLDFRPLPTPGGDAELYLRFRDRLSEIRGVEVVGAVSDLPLSGTGPVDAFTPDMADTVAAWDNALASYLPVLPGYFESVNIPLQLGRFFTDSETREGDQIVIVDETLARMAFPGEDPIGKTLRLGWGIPDSRIVGVVAHARIMDPRKEVRPQIYVPYGLFRWNPLHFTVRAEGDPLALIPAVREAARDVGTGRALSGFQLLSENVATASSTLRAVSILVVVLAISAALLSALGLYAVVSSVVIQKRKATAIRGALGASPRDLLRKELSSGTRVLILALPVGIILSLMGGRMLESLVFGVPVRDPLSLLAAVGLGVLVALGGTFLPALRASRTDPASALQAD